MMFNTSAFLTFERTQMEQNVSDFRFKQESFIDILRLPFNYATSVILILGALGNTLSIVVLSFKFSQMSRNIESLEKPAYAGLLALATSDLLFCIVCFISIIPTGLLPKGFEIYQFFYRGILSQPLRNLFIFSSSWIMVVISSERFLAVWHPIYARQFLKLRNNVASSLIIVFVALLFNLPLFFSKHFIKKNCALSKSGTTNCIYSVMPSTLFAKDSFKLTYFVLLSVFDTFLPLVTLTFTNVSLVVLLLRNRAKKLLKGHRYGCTRITIMVVVMETSFLFLVCPSMVIKSIELILDRKVYLMAILITQFTTALNFSSNFFVYCGFMKHWKDIFRRIIGCSTQEKNSSRYDMRSINHSSTRLNKIHSNYG